MSRAWRIEYPGALYHVLSRGNERRDIFVDDDDRCMFLDTLGEMVERFELDIAAYVLMGNHYHLLLRTHRANLSKSMQWFGVTYTNRFNSLNSHSGHLFQGRFKSMIVQNDAYLLRLSYYIHRNPVRAGMVERRSGAAVSCNLRSSPSSPASASGGEAGVSGSAADGSAARTAALRLPLTRSSLARRSRCSPRS